ncbi:MAG TPA: acylphosphatase [Bacteroidales bacterium]|jgi:acylphosphatase|nr:acylphosphatase [Bacteroidales bacterium]
MERLLYKITITGSVQGVGFRWNAVREARSRGITGYAKNLDDGSVYIEAEGSGTQLDDFLIWCRTGPAFASVESVVFDVAEAVGYRDFGIER